MRSNSRASKIRRSWGGRLLATAGTVGLLLALAPPGVAVATGTTWVVKPGQSIQAAADKASSGDTIKIEAGKYYEAVCIEGKGLTIRGAGRDSTIILPPPTATANDCWVPGTPEGGTVENVSALKFLNPDRPVAVTDLQTNGHPEDGSSFGAPRVSPSSTPRVSGTGCTESSPPQGRPTSSSPTTSNRARQARSVPSGPRASRWATRRMRRR